MRRGVPPRTVPAGRARDVNAIPVYVTVDVAVVVVVKSRAKLSGQVSRGVANREIRSPRPADGSARSFTAFDSRLGDPAVKRSASRSLGGEIRGTIRRGRASPWWSTRIAVT